MNASEIKQNKINARHTHPKLKVKGTRSNGKTILNMTLQKSAV